MSDHPLIDLHVQRLRRHLTASDFSDGLSEECARGVRRYLEIRADALRMCAGVCKPESLKLETEAVLAFDDPGRPEHVAECVEGPARRLLEFAKARRRPARSEFGGAPLVARPVDEVGWVVGRWISISIERGLW